ncbi:MAG: TerC family protein, partial [Proteobacteria bacterium]|nr:TerC family protein [Pseudomonadota bacterium]
LGLALAMITRILLLLSLTWVMGLTTPLFEIFSREISGRNLILLAGGLFLLGKSTHEIHNSLEIPAETGQEESKAISFAGVLLQVAVIDLVFSLDSVITAVGLANRVEVMITAIVVAVGVMMVAAKAIGDFVDSHPTFKILALSFLLLVGFSLVGEGFGLHIPKGYVYFAMAFSAGVEVLNMKVRTRPSTRVKLHRATDEI